MIVENISIVSGKTYQMDLPVTDEQIKEWVGGKLIQNVMPQLNAIQREFLISGMNEEEQIKFFGK